jgi:hypothetical protein
MPLGTVCAPAARPFEERVGGEGAPFVRAFVALFAGCRVGGRECEGDDGVAGDGAELLVGDVAAEGVDDVLASAGDIDGG